MMGANEGEEFLLWVGGHHAQGILDGAPALYWPEVWGARALLTAWDDSATAAIEQGLRNQAWRVREMCGRVCAERGLPLGSTLVRLLTDENARVRAVGARAIARVGDAEQAKLVKRMLRDPEVEVRRQAGAALAVLTERLGAPIDD
nr:HEAT repeat domain-containing protein [Galbitalea soli]